MKAGIAGAGIMGQLLAFSLLQAGWEVALFDKDEKNNCSSAAAGLLTPLAELATNDPLIFQLGCEALSIHWPNVLAQLKQASGQEIYFRREGSIVVSHRRDKAELEHFIRKISAKLSNDMRRCERSEAIQAALNSPPEEGWHAKRDGVVETYLPSSALRAPSPVSGEGIKQISTTPPFGHPSSGGEFKKLNHTDLITLEPALSKFEEGYYFPTEGQIDNQHLLTTLKKNLQSKNITWSTETVLEVHPHEIKLPHQTLFFDCVFDCRGLGAKAIFKDLYSLRGELIWLYAPDLKIDRPIRFSHPHYNLYIVPRPDNIYLVGASEIASEDASPISVQSTLELLTAAYAVNSKFAEARILKTVSQCRPSLPHHLPQIKYQDGLIAVNGLYRHGFLIAPTLAHEAMAGFQNLEARSYPSLWKKINERQ